MALPYSYAVKADVPGLFQDPSWFIHGNSKQHEKEKEGQRNEAIDNGPFFLSHGSCAPTEMIVAGHRANSILFMSVLSALLPAKSFFRLLLVPGPSTL